MTQPQAQSQLGRSALLVHGIMWLAASVCVGIITSLNDDGKTLAVPLTASFALYCWSMLLAIRALRSGEKTTWPVTVLIAGLIESAAFFAWMGTQWNWNFEPAQWAYHVGLPVFVPSLVVAIIIAAPIARWRVSGAEDASVANGAGPWERQRRWKYGMYWFAPIAFCTFLLLFPVPLFCYMLLNEKYLPSSRTPQSLDNWVIQRTPSFVADTTVTLMPLSSWPRCLEIHGLALASGRPSRDRLISELSSPNPLLQGYALAGLEKVDPVVAAARSEMMGLSGALVSPADLIAAGIVARSGTVEQIRHVMDSMEKSAVMSSSSFEVTLLNDLFRIAQRPEFMPDLVRLAESKTPYRDFVLQTIAEFGPPKDVESLWMRWMDDSVNKRVTETMMAISSISDEKLQSRLQQAGLKHENPHVRLMAIKSLNNLAPKELSVIKQLSELMNDEDLDVRRWSTFMVAMVMGRPCSGNPQSSQPESDPEMLERKGIRTAMEKWLEEHSESNPKPQK